MRSKEIEEHKSLLKLNNKQRSIIVGTLLGDSHLETQNNGLTYRLKVEHSITQAGYVDWLYAQFADWVRTQPQRKQKYLNGTKYENYYFQTLSVGQLRFYAKKFYDDSGRKVVPSQIGHWLTPLALAVWFMDDGSSKSKQHRAIILNTHCFSQKDIAFLQKALATGYGIEATTRKQREGLQLLIAGQSARRFYQVVQPHILPNFQYKFGALVNIFA